jgi:hypothetical protein
MKKKIRIQFIPTLSSVIVATALIFTFSQDLFAQSTMKPFSELIWKNRVIVVFADDFDDEYYKNQMQILKGDTMDLKERGLMVIGVSKGQIKEEYGSSSNNYDAKAIRNYYRINDGVSSTILIGKDSGEKRRWSALVETIKIFGLIDSMPMRQSEMRKNKK